MQKPVRERPSGIAIVLIIGLAVLTVGGAIFAFQLPDAITTQGDDIRALYMATLVISFAVFFIVTAGIIWAVFNYRRKSADDMPVQIHGSSSLEFIWTIIPIIILVGLFVPSLLLVIDLKTPPAEADADVVIDVIGHQWWWEFDYGSEGVRVQAGPPNYDNLEPPRMVVPAGAKVLLRIRSTDVVHSFYAPNLLYKIQAVPGNINEMYFDLKGDDVGTYSGQCYQFCGLRHADMHWILDVRSQADYDRWLADTRRQQAATPSTVPGSGPTPTRTATPGAR